MKASILLGHVMDRLDDIPASSIHTVITSPPYYQLRNYGTDHRVWGGMPGCAHNWEYAGRTHKGGKHGVGLATVGRDQSARNAVKDIGHGAFCTLCQAWTGELGSEPTPELYVEHMVEIGRKLWRVLRDDGTLWLNLGDTTWAGGSTTKKSNDAANYDDRRTMAGAHRGGSQRRVKPRKHPWLKVGDLIGIPNMVATAFQVDGWWKRSEVVWHKPNSMPASGKDRPTPCHEMFFLLTKRGPGKYYYDYEGGKEPSVAGGKKSGNRARKANHQPGRGNFATGIPWEGSATRNRRSVMTVTTKPYKGAHFATFNRELVTPFIQIGSSDEGCCAECGAPMERALEDFGRPEGSGRPRDARARILESMSKNMVTVGWTPTCACPKQETVPCRVLDPFFGAGTTGLTALLMGREAIGIELNPDYALMAGERLLKDVPGVRLSYD